MVELRCSLLGHDCRKVRIRPPTRPTAEAITKDGGVFVVDDSELGLMIHQRSSQPHQLNVAYLNLRLSHAQIVGLREFLVLSRSCVNLRFAASTAALRQNAASYLAAFRLMKAGSAPTGRNDANDGANVDGTDPGRCRSAAR